MKCKTCGQEMEMDVPGDIWSRNCGGDCRKCMAEAGDPDCEEGESEEGESDEVA